MIKFKLIIAFIVSPLVFGGIIFFASLFKNAFEGFWFFILSSAVAYVVTAVIGIPTYLILRKFKLNNFPIYLVSSMFLSLVPASYLFIYPKLGGGGNLTSSDLSLSALIIVGGLVTASSFWFIARPDKLAD